ncbi:AAA family ATPase [Plantactinospora sp. WMMB782]|uniref:AAA family ATPase n=1 Tax=Plantactinospora sp. WMMB782 TaxID=3404121 RepID=UPI003B92A41C
MDGTETGWGRPAESAPRWRALLDRALHGGRTDEQQTVGERPGPEPAADGGHAAGRSAGYPGGRPERDPRPPAPGYPAGPGYPPAPGYGGAGQPAESRYAALESGYRPDPGFGAGRPTDPGFGPGRPVDPGPGAGRPADPGFGSGRSTDPGFGAGRPADPGFGPGRSTDPGFGAGRSTDPGFGAGRPAEPGYRPGPTHPAEPGFRPGPDHRPGAADRREPGYQPGGYRPDPGYHRGEPEAYRSEPAGPDYPGESRYAGLGGYQPPPVVPAPRPALPGPPPPTRRPDSGAAPALPPPATGRSIPAPRASLAPPVTPAAPPVGPAPAPAGNYPAADVGYAPVSRRASLDPFAGRPQRSADPEVERARNVLRRELGSPRVIAFANPKGGVHKTTATVLGAATVGSVRGRGVLAWDDNELRGTLGLRAGSARHARTIRHLVADLIEIEALPSNQLLDRLDDYLRHASDGSYDVLAGEESPRFAQRLDQHTVRRVLELLRRTHDVICVDTGNNVESSNWQTVLRAADQLVVTTVPREDAAFTADWMLDLLHDIGMGELADNAVTLLSCPTPGRSPLLDDLKRHFATRTRAVAVVPYDPALETGSSIEYAQLAQETRDAWLQAASMMLEPFAR